MFISHKSNVIQTVHETEWQCRKNTKGLTKSEYWVWLDSVTSGDPPEPDYSGETGYTIVECIDEDAQSRLDQLDVYINQNRVPGEAKVYNIKWSDSKTKVTVDDIEIETHFAGDDSAKDARLLAEQWTGIRRERDRLLTETDWMTFADSPALSDDWKTYRQTLRDLPNAQKAKTTYASITWPTKPS